MRELGAGSLWQALLVDIRAGLRSSGLHSEAEQVSHKLEAALRSRGLLESGYDGSDNSRVAELQTATDLYNVCFELLQTNNSTQNIACLQQTLWSRNREVTRELLLLYQQQQQQLESLGGRHQGLRQEHQVLKANLRSLKITVQQLLTDVSTLLQHTASAKQQQQQQQEPIHQQQHAVGTWTEQPELQQQLHRAGLTSTASCSSSSRITYRGHTGHRRCVSDDGGGVKPAAAAAAAGDSQSGVVALTMQRLITSIERMSRHFADCQAGKLIEGYTESTNPASDATQPVERRADSAVSSTTSFGTTLGVRYRSSSSGGSSTAVTAGAQGADGLHIISGAGVNRRPSSSRGSTAHGTTCTSSTQGPRAQPTPKPPSSSSSGRPSSGSSGGSSSRQGLRAPGPPVLGGVAAAAAALSSVMAEGTVLKGASGKPGSGSSQQQQRQQQWRHTEALQGVSADAAMRHSLDSEQAKAAVDAWFAQKARASAAAMDAPITSSRGHGLSALDTSASAAGYMQGSNAASVRPQVSRPSCVSSPDSSVLQSPSAYSTAESTDSKHQSADAAAGQAHAPVMEPSEQQSLADEASNSSGSSLGPSISERVVLQVAPGDTSHAAQDTVTCSADDASAGSSRSSTAAGSKADTKPPAATAAVAATRASAAPTGRGRPRERPLGSSSSTSSSHPSGAPAPKRPYRVLTSPASAEAAEADTGSRLPKDSPTGHVGSPQVVSLHAGSSHSGPGSDSWGSASSSPGKMLGVQGPYNSTRQSHPTSSTAAAAAGVRGPRLRLFGGAEQAMGSGPLTAALHSVTARRSTLVSSSSAVSTSSVSAAGAVTAGAAAGSGRDSRLVNIPSSRSASSCSQHSDSSGGCTGMALCHQLKAAAAAAGGGACDRAASDAAGAYRAPIAAGDGATADAAAGVDGDSAGQKRSGARQGITAGYGGGGVTAPLRCSSKASDAALQPAAANSLGASSTRVLPCPPSSYVQTTGDSTASKSHHTTSRALTPAANATQQELCSQQTPYQQQRESAGRMVGLAASAEVIERPQPPHRPAAAASGPRSTARQARPTAAGTQKAAQPLLPVAQHQVGEVPQVRQQPRAQSAPPTVLSSRAQSGQLSPIIEEVSGYASSCNTTPRTSVTDPADAAPLKNAYGSNSGCRGGSKSRGTRGGPAAAAASASASVSSKGGGWASAAAGAGPIPVRAGTESPPDTAGGKDTAPEVRSNNSTSSGRNKCGSVHDKQPPPLQESSAGSTSSMHCTALSRLGSSGSPSMTTSKGTRGTGQAHQRCSSWDGSGSNGQQLLLAATPADLGPMSYSLDSLETLLLDTSCCQSDEEGCADILCGGGAGASGSSGSDRLALQAAAAAGCGGGEGLESGECCDSSSTLGGAGGLLELQDLLAVVLDVLNDKHAADKRYMASGLPQPSLGRHLQCYVAAQVHSNQAAYSGAMSAILTGLEQHKQVQPEIAVFCRVLSDELDEGYFQNRHLKLRQHLQQLATAAVLSGIPQQTAQSSSWEHCCSMPLFEQQLQALLQAWVAERGKVLRGQHTEQSTPHLLSSWEQEIRVHCGCGPGEAVRAGSAVATLLLWELAQQLQHLKPLADAFRAADVRLQGVLGLEQFTVFCKRLNASMSQEEVQALFDEELRAQGHEQVTFSAICRALLPAM